MSGILRGNKAGATESEVGGQGGNLWHFVPLGTVVGDSGNELVGAL